MKKRKSTCCTWCREAQPAFCVPRLNKLHADVLHDCHDAPTAGHSGFSKTLERAIRTFHWPNMSHTIKAYVSSCEECQRDKPSNRNAQALLQPLDVPTETWQSISMDFLTQLPATPSGFDAISVVGISPHQCRSNRVKEGEGEEDSQSASRGPTRQTSNEISSFSQ